MLLHVFVLFFFFFFLFALCFFFQAEDGIRDLVRSRGLGDVYKRQVTTPAETGIVRSVRRYSVSNGSRHGKKIFFLCLISMWCCLLYTSDAADERSSVDLGGRRIIKKKNIKNVCG